MSKKKTEFHITQTAICSEQQIFTVFAENEDQAIDMFLDQKKSKKIMKTIQFGEIEYLSFHDFNIHKAEPTIEKIGKEISKSEFEQVMKTKYAS